MNLPRRGYFRSCSNLIPIIVHSLHPNQTAIVEFEDGVIRLTSFSEIQLTPYTEPQPTPPLY